MSRADRPCRCFSLLATPFEEDGGIDLFALDRLLDQGAGYGKGVGFGAAVGFPEGEGGSLSLEEYRLILEETVLVLSGRGRVLAGCYAESTAEAAKKGEIGARAGADLLFFPPPYGISPCSGAYFCHLKTLSLLGVPFLTCFPAGEGRGREELLLCQECARLPHFAGFVLESIDRPTWGLWQSSHPETPLYMKNDSLSLPALFSGFSGLISPLSCLLPRQTALLVSECAAGGARALPIWRALFPLCALLGRQEGGALLKWGLHKRGLLTPAMRLPHTLPEKRLLADLERALEGAQEGVRRVVPCVKSGQNRF